MAAVAEANVLPPHVAEMVAGMIRAWGGVDSFCREYRLLCESAPDKEKRHFMLPIMTMLAKTTEMGASEEQYEQMSAADLQHRLRQEIGEPRSPLP